MKFEPYPFNQDECLQLDFALKKVAKGEQVGPWAMEVFTDYNIIRTKRDGSIVLSDVGLSFQQAGGFEEERKKQEELAAQAQLFIKRQLVANRHPFPKDYNEAVRWARHVVQHAEQYVIIDTETTGLKNNDVIVQIGILSLQGEELLNQLIKPGKRKTIPKRATEIHGISTDMIKDSPRLLDIMPQIKALLKGKKLIYYNKDYDTSRIVESLYQDERHRNPENCEIFERGECAMEYYAQYVGKWNDYHYDYTWQKLPNKRDDAHQAISDCKATSDLIFQMAGSDILLEDGVSITKEALVAYKKRWEVKRPLIKLF